MIQPSSDARQRLKRMYGYIGAICWVLILPAKEARRLDLGIDPVVFGIAPSFIGSAGLVLVILSSERRSPCLTIARGTLRAGTVALALELAQILPFVRRIYTFDWFDVAATLCGLGAGALVAASMRRWYPAAR